jgi:uncharacterized membrane protein YeaQ/YmgE (transglycosylase-associated protein family)
VNEKYTRLGKLKEMKMEIVLVIIAMLVVGVIAGALAGPIWKNKRPIGVRGDYIAAIVTAVAVGLLDYFVIPAMGFSENMKWLGVAFEPFLGALLVLWIIRRARQ